MTYLGGSLAAMTADRNLWKGRADSSWGATRVWNSGASWEANYNTSQAALASMTAERDSWYTNYNNAIASRDYWQHTVAHNDADVWNTRYAAGDAAGYARADAAESPRALSNYTFTATIPAHNGTHQACTLSGAGGAGVLTNNGTSLTAVRPGYWSIYMVAGGYNNVTSRIYTEGSLRADKGGTPNAPDYLDGIGAHWVGFINANGGISFTGRSQQASYGATITVTFVPVPGYQQ